MHSNRTWILVTAMIWALTGCNGPTAWIPGGALDGPEGDPSNWLPAAMDAETLELETRPEEPYSVRVGFVLRDDRVFIDPASGRRWYDHLAANNQVRVRFSDAIYRARATEITDPDERVGFDADRHVFRLDVEH